jgi:hypothetical protein
MSGPNNATLPTIGWREWIALPELGVERIKVKVDTGARTSALHAFDIQTYRRRSVTYIRFQIHPLQRAQEPTIQARARVLEFRDVRSSSGHLTQRPVIVTNVQWGTMIWPIELTLTSRDEMGFRMLLGRQAIRQRLLVDSSSSFLAP